MHGCRFRSASSTVAVTLSSPTATVTNGLSANLKMDLLSGYDDSLALVPVGETQTASPVSQQNALALVDMFSQDNATQSNYSAGQTYSSTQSQLPQNFQSPQPSVYPTASVPTTASPHYEQSLYAQGTNPNWNGQVSQQQQQDQQPPSAAYG